MTDQGLFSLFLLLHVGAAIAGFGPTFAFQVIGRLGAAEREHGNFATRVVETITERLTIPLALTMPVSGVLMIWFAKFDLLNRAFYWLDLGIVLYVITLGVALFVQRPTVLRMIALTTRPAGGPAAGGPPAGGPPAGGPPAGGPPPEIAETARKIQRNGAFLGLMIVLIVILMVVKPQF